MYDTSKLPHQLTFYLIFLPPPSLSSLMKSTWADRDREMVP